MNMALQRVSSTRGRVHPGRSPVRNTVALVYVCVCVCVYMYVCVSVQ